MSNFIQARDALIARILEGPGHSSPQQRKAAFNNAGLNAPVCALIAKVAQQPREVTDDDNAAAQDAGLNEDQIFELIVCGAVGQATRQYDNAIAALHAAVERA